MTQLKAVQIEALSRSAGAKGYVFGMDMGLGKSLTAYQEFLTLVELGVMDRMVVVAPNSFKPGWPAEAHKQGLPLDVFIYEATKGRKVKRWLEGPFHQPPVLVVNYESLRAPHVQDLILGFIAGKRSYLVFDESIKLKDRKAQQTKAALHLAPAFTMVRLLSGKMQTQGPHDNWSQLKVIGHMPMTFWKFRAEYCRLGGYMNKEVVGVKNAEGLKRILSRCAFIATKAEWGFDIPKIYTSRYYELDGILKEKFEEMREEFMTWLNAHEHVAVEIAITKYMKLAQIQCGFIIDENEEVHWLVEPEKNPRLRLLAEILADETNGQKVAIVFRHRAVAQLLLDYLPNAAVIMGGMKPEKIEFEKERFNLDPACRQILLQADASKYGHTLVGTKEDPCATMIFFEGTYSLDTRSQVEDRIHRIGQEAETCMYIDLIGSEIDERVTNAIQKKEKMFREVFREEEL